MAFWNIASPLRLSLIGGLAMIGASMYNSTLFGAEAPVIIAPPTLDNPKSTGSSQTAVLAGGCFWGVQGVFEHARGVQKVVAGYAGGEKSTAQYETVSSGSTGHAESVKITFDPAVISYGQILQIAFSVVHDPTQVNRQGPDVGTQYRSAIFYADESQKRIAQAYISQLDQAHVYPRPIATRVDPLTGFYAAEDYHQDYLIHNPTQPYIAMYDLPKIENFRRTFPELYSGRPVLAHN
ncbi:MAG: peptide-methionine (S)-S-oxide reductase [Gammaproteobacteria bacterium]|jgi:peptide-methionine (S)-S-oxide reductase|nr:peptide-methionine (S)-S-oxide reductase [Gammaproteobacteria bacterium]